ncbi:MAG: ATP-binding protein [Gallionellaceae bacterium]|jgi:PAS domain S-box-containing protein
MSNLQPEYLTVGELFARKALREKAEEIARGKSAELFNDPDTPSIESMQRVLQELCVYQIELEMQNEQLRQTQIELENARQRYFDLYDLAPAGYCTLSEKGQILQCNLKASTLLGQVRNKLVNYPLHNYFALTSVNYYFDWLTKLLAGDELSTLEVAIAELRDPQCWLQLTGALAEEGDGKRVVRIIFNDITERKKMDAERMHFLNTLDEAARQLVGKQESIRRELATQLHERTSPNLAAMQINLNMMEISDPQTSAAELQNRLDDIRALLEDTNSSIREICTDMRSPLLDYAGLSAAIEGYVRQFMQRTKTPVQLMSTLGEARFEANVESLIFRIIQEALTNCAKHAQARLISVTLRHDAHFITLNIADNGVGFDMKQIKKMGTIGLGLINMQEMAQVAGGEFSIESALNQGTKIRVFISSPRILL